MTNAFGWFIRSLPSFRGKLRLIRLFDRLLQIIRVQSKVSVRDVRYIVQTRDLVDFMILYTGSPSTAVNEAVSFAIDRTSFALQNLAKPSEITFFDIGANVGGITLPILKKNTNVKAYAFEPNPSTLSRLIRNIGLNPEIATRSVIIGSAIGSSLGHQNFGMEFNANNSGTASIRNSEFTVQPISLRVWCDTIDNLVEIGAIPTPHVVKIDVEGFELNVVRGAIKTFSKNKVWIVLEHSPYRYNISSEYSPIAVYEELKKIGYNFYTFNSSTCTLDELNREAFSRNDLEFDYIATNSNWTPPPPFGKVAVSNSDICK
jgi:FkbM family methyltransferase